MESMMMKFEEPVITLYEAKLPEHKAEGLLATRTYLVMAYRENEENPFSHMLLTGESIVSNELHLQTTYKFFLLPEFQNKRY